MKSFYSIAFFLVLVLLSQSSKTEPVLKAGYGIREDSILVKAFVELMNDVFHGYKLEFNSYPGGRSLTMADRGQIDIELGRIGVDLARHENLVRIPTPIGEANIYLVLREDLPYIKKLNELNEFEIAITHKAAFQEDPLIRALSFKRFYFFDRSQAKKILMRGRVNYMLYANYDGIPLDVPKNFKLQLLFKRPIYSHVHKKHKGLVAELNRRYQLHFVERKALSSALEQILGDKFQLSKLKPLVE